VIAGCPAPCFAKAKPLWLRGGEFAGHDSID